MRKQSTKRGFTITELVIVIAVVAILAAVLIPTFANLIKRANESADIQVVRQMNTILRAEEVVSGKPADVDAVKAILTENGIADFTPAMAEHAFAWDNEENVIVLINTTTQKGVFPKEYKDVPYEASWELLAGNVKISMEELGAANLDEALAKAKPGQTILLSSDQTLSAATPIENANIDLGGHKLTLNSLPMEENGNIVLSNGNVDSSYISINTGATLTLNDVNLTDTDGGTAIGIAKHGATVNINGGTIISDCVIGTAYSQNAARAAVINVTNAQFGTQENPCGIGIFMITSGDVTVSNCTIYATDAALIDRAGDMTVENTVINYQPTVDYVDTYGGGWVEENLYKGVTPGNIRQYSWKSGSGGFKAPIVVGDFWAEEYSFDANCTLVNVTVNSTNDTYPDVYLSQEGYDVVPWGAGTNAYGQKNLDWANLSATNPKREKTVLKTNLTCDSTIAWAVNPGKNDEFVANATGNLAPFANYAGFQYSGSYYGGVALLYVDNVFVNGVEQAAGSTSATPVPAN